MTIHSVRCVHSQLYVWEIMRTLYGIPADIGTDAVLN